jgi:hypothetical protein
VREEVKKENKEKSEHECGREHDIFIINNS